MLDVPRSDAAVLDALEGVATIVIVANQELATVRNAGRMAATLRQRYGKERVTIVVSRFDQQAEIGDEDVERVVGSPVKYTFPSDYRLALQALNKGRPIALDKDNKLSPAFQAMAFDLAGVRVEKAAEAPRSGGLLRPAAEVEPDARRAEFSSAMEADNSTWRIRRFQRPAGDTRSPHYQELKAQVHQELLNRLNLERLTRVSRARPSRRSAS